MTYVPLTQAGVLSALSLTTAQFARLQLLAPVPIAPDQIVSATLTEYFLMTPENVFSDSTGNFTTLATVGGTVGSVRAKNSRAETLIQTTSGSQPTFAREANSGTMGLLGNGTSTSMVRSYTGTVGTVLAIYALNPAAPTRPYQVVGITQSATSGKNHLTLYGNRTGTLDTCRYAQDRSDGTTLIVDVAPYLGDPDVLLIRSDGTTAEMDRAGQTICIPVTGTGTGLAPAGTAGSAVVMSGLSSTGTANNWMKGTLIAWVTFSGKVADAEMPGLIAWGRSLVRKPVTGRYLGFYFYGDGSDESGSAQAMAMVRSDDLINWTHGPIGAGIDKNGLFPKRDYGVCYDPATAGVFTTTTTGATGTTKIYGCFDKFHFTQTGIFSTTSLVSGTSSQIWASEFVKNQDGSLWKDTSGLPRIVLCYSSDGQFDFNIATIKPVDTTWGTGGAWNSAVPMTWATTPTDLIDPSMVMTTDGTFHLFGATRTAAGPGNSTIRHATATSIDGTWTINSSSDVFGFGSTWESPQPIYRASDGAWILHLDKQGLGYYWSISTTGIAGTYSTPKPINCPFIAQHGNMIPTPPGW